MEKHVYLVRHGESDANSDGIIRGAHAMLNEKGKEQATLVAERIKKIGVDALISSPYTRTLETAQAISDAIDLPIEESELFVERRRPTVVHGLSWKTDPRVNEIMSEIHEGYILEVHRHSDEENFEDLRTRANDALEFLAQHEKDRVCVVTHGIFLRVLLTAILSGPEFSGRNLLHAIRSVDTDNTGVTHIILRENHYSEHPKYHWVLKNWNDSAHLG